MLRNDLEANTTLIKYLDFGELKVFSTALGQHNAITIFKKGNDFSRNLETIITKRNGHLELSPFNEIISGKDVLSDYYEVNQSEIYEGKQNYLRIKGFKGGNSISERIFNAFKSLPLITEYTHVRQGLRTGIDKITDSHLKKFDLHFEKGEGVFILTQSECIKNGFKSDTLLRRLYKNSDINKYFVNDESQYRILYIDKSFTYNRLSSNHKDILLHIEKYKKLICNIRGSNNESLTDWYTLDRPREEWIFTSEKIVAPQRSKRNTFAYSNTDFFGSADIYYIIPFDNNVNAKYLTAVLNSKLYYFWYYNKGKRKGEMLELYQQPLSETPIKIAPFNSIYEYLLDSIIVIGKTNDKINADIPNKHISKAFEEVIDALVFELYFPEEFAEKDIEIEKYAKDIFKHIEGLTEEEQIKAIQEAYQTLQEKDNPLRNQIKLMKIELKELLLPILSV